jgi:hypothetical protein
MKRLALASMALLTIICSAKAQQNGAASKPALFSSYADVIPCTLTELNRAFTSAENQTITLGLNSNFIFSGTTLSNVVKYSTLQSVIIKSPIFSNAIFHLSKRTNTDGSISFAGRIINPAYKDGYELHRDAGGNYQLEKFETDNVIQVCAQ